MKSVLTFAGLAFASFAAAGPCRPRTTTTASSAAVSSSTEIASSTATETAAASTSTDYSVPVVSESSTTLATVIVSETSATDTSAAETSTVGSTTAETSAVGTTTAETSAADTTATAKGTTTEATTAETTTAETTTAETSANTATEGTTATAADTTTTAAGTTTADTTTEATTTAEGTTTTADTTTTAEGTTTTADTTTADTTTTTEATTTADTTTADTTTGTATTQTAEPTADQSCDNGGLEYAIYTHDFYNSDPPHFSSFDATYFHDATPTFQGKTSRIGIPPGTPSDTTFAIYDDSPPQKFQYKAVNHQAFLYAPDTGDYKVTIPNSDEITLIWFGTKAVSGWTRDNADLEQDYPGGTSKSFIIHLTAGTYTPFRLLWANAQGDLNFIAEVQAPDGTVIVNGDGSDNRYFVRFACDESTPSFPPFGPDY